MIQPAGPARTPRERQVPAGPQVLDGPVRGPTSPAANGPAGSRRSPEVLDQAPRIVIWELTRACELVCAHCRAAAQPQAHPEELGDDEGRRLLSQIREAFGPVLVVLTGGDPLLRPGLLGLIRHGAGLGLRMALTPSATPRLTRDTLAAVQAAGIVRLALSLDGATAASHDARRGVPGTYARTIAALAAAQELGLQTQINSAIGQANREELDALAAIGAWHGIALWSVFLLVPTGRAGPELLLTAAEHERTYRHLARLALDPATPFAIKTTAGQPFQRVLAQERRRRGLSEPAPGRSFGGINDGKGFCFISHVGDIQPSGFLPVTCGNVRSDDLAAVYREHELFRGLRDPDRLGGKCGICPWREACGGSRSRSWALTGDPYAADPTCVYRPRRASDGTKAGQMNQALATGATKVAH